MNIIKSTLLIILSCFLCVSCTKDEGKEKQNAILKTYSFVVENNSSITNDKYDACLDLSKLELKGVLKSDNFVLFNEQDQQLAFQFDDLNGDGIYDQLAFQAVIKANSKSVFKLSKLKKNSKLKIKFDNTLHAQMGLKDGKNKYILKDSLFAANGDLYKKTMHHGPATESEIIAYRMYLDDRCSIDIYGKKMQRLELDSTKWYSNDELTKANFGGDILFVAKTMGIGSLRLWENNTAKVFKSVKERYAVVRSKGPVRTIIDMVAPEVESEKGNFSHTLRMIQYAGKRELQIESYASNDELQFCTGIRKFDDSMYLEDDKMTYMSLWGTDFPRLDHEKYPAVTVGLGVCIPSKQFERFTKDSINHIAILKGNILKYKIAAAWLQEEKGPKTNVQFNEIVKNIAEEIKVNENIKIIK